MTEALDARITLPIVEALDQVRQCPTLPVPEHLSFDELHEWALQFPDNELAKLCGPQCVQKVLERKRGKGLF